jgi:hypothetical protein
MAITCREFERRWNERLDAVVARSDRGSSEADRDVMVHAAGCFSCCEKATKYEALRSAILAGGPPPLPAGMADRILSELEAPTTTSAWPVHATYRDPARWIRGRKLIAAASIAACVLIVVVLDREKLKGPAVVLHPGPVEEHGDRRIDSRTATDDYRTLNTALADATEATLDLARAASLPAARIGRQVIDVAAGPEPGSALTAPAAGGDSIAMVVAVPSLDALAPDPAAAAAMWQHVGDGLADGVRPLTSTARHAFGFLFGPAEVKPELRNNPPADKGA